MSCSGAGDDIDESHSKIKGQADNYST